jgi:hypothetical protein
MRMSAIDTVKQIVAEIVGDGKLAKEGARQTHESSAPTDAEGRTPQTLRRR